MGGICGSVRDCSWGARGSKATEKLNGDNSTSLLGRSANSPIFFLLSAVFASFMSPFNVFLPVVLIFGSFLFTVALFLRRGVTPSAFLTTSHSLSCGLPCSLATRAAMEQRS